MFVQLSKYYLIYCVFMYYGRFFLNVYACCVVFLIDIGQFCLYIADF